MTPRITAVVFTPSSALDAADGMLGWLRVQVDQWLEIDGVVLRRSSHGELRLHFPSRVDRAGFRRHYARPMNEPSRVAIQEQVIAQLRRERRLPS
jgi:DNA-binding cell septation regulator SpoVG